jgi:MoxR-like ATPase
VEAHKLGGQAPTADVAAASETAQRVIENVARVIHAPRSLIARCVMGVLCEGHIILEDFPGVG